MSTDGAVPERWRARYADCMETELWYTSKEMAGVLVELGTAESLLRDTVQVLLDVKLYMDLKGDDAWVRTIDAALEKIPKELRDAK